MVFAWRGRSLDHHDEDYATLVPSANPAHTPPVDAITQVGTLEEAQELGFNFHSHPWIALSVWTVKAARGSATRGCSLTEERPVKSARLTGMGPFL